VGLAHPSIAPYGVYACQDGVRLLISVQNEREWQRLVREVLALPELLADSRFASNVDRVRHGEVLDAAIAPVFSATASPDVTSKLDRAGIAFGVLNDMAGLASHPQLRRIRIDTPGGPVEYPAPGFWTVGEVRCYGPVPQLGEPPSPTAPD
jgi:formyl-CoA transferase